MGFFTGQVFNEDFSYRNVSEAKGYDDGYYSAKDAMVTYVQNEQQLFEGLVLCDIQESVMRLNGANEYEIMAYTENVLTDMLDKIKEFIMKAWEKIKAIFKGWMAKFDSVMMKSNKEFVNKYKDTVLKKDLTDMEVKWRKPKSPFNIPEFNNTGMENTLDVTKHLSDGQAKLDKWDEESETETIMKTNIDKSLTDANDFEKDFIDLLFEDEDTDDKIDIHAIMSELLTFKDTKKNWDKSNKSLNKALDKMVKEIEKDQTAFAKANPIKNDETSGKFGLSSEIKYKKYSLNNKSDNRYDYTSSDTQVNGAITGVKAAGGSGYDTIADATTAVKEYQKALNIVHKYANIYVKVANKYTAAVMKALKLQNSQNRMVWAKAVAYSRKEESVMTEAMMELAQYDVDLQ